MNDEYFMHEALKEARLALEEGEVPVGAVIIKDGQIIGRGHNKRETDNRISGHAEIIAIEEAEKALNSWKLEGCHLYVTLEPCLMCAGALLQARISCLVFGAKDEAKGAITSNYHVFDEERSFASPLVQEGLLKEECENLLKGFFESKRQ